MAIQSSSATFTRFFVPDPVTEDFWSYVDEQLRAGSFKECEDGQEQAAGFSSWDDFFDASFAYGSYHKGEYVAFNFRLDQRKVPAIVLKQHIRQAIHKYRSEHEGKWPSRHEKMEIQENVQNWLLNRVLPQPSHCEVVWSPTGKWMLLGTTSSKMMEALLELFERRFNIYPVPLYHVHWALNLTPLTSNQKDKLSSMVSVKSPQALNDGRFLGYEFLTWLWCVSELSDGKLKLSEKQAAELTLGERVVLCLPGEGREKVICTTQANALHEARTALQQGKFVEELQIFLRVGENDYFLTLDSSLWTIKGLKTPKQAPDYEEEDSEGKFLEKMFFIEEVSSVLNAIYAQFLANRLSPAWDSDILPVLKQWIEGKEQQQAIPF
ncbi:MAG: recombination-associated protein RdgC [Desulforhabdus sp.]|jgi:DNA recombination-dependent growth factor C|nr:recombination-associated protein RdgC [Desulforhabdus sp.]